jgi:hypothetical protein
MSDFSCFIFNFKQLATCGHMSNPETIYAVSTQSDSEMEVIKILQKVFPYF